VCVLSDGVRGPEMRKSSGGPCQQRLLVVKLNKIYYRDWACSLMVGWSSGTLPISVQILVLAPFPGFSRIYRRYALSGKRRSRRRRGAIGDFGNLQISRCSVLRRWLRRVGFAYVYCVHVVSICVVLCNFKKTKSYYR
jgi:hypothetical protein